MAGQGKCIIWGTSASIKDDIRDDHKHILDSPRAGGKYIVEHQLYLGACRNGLNLDDEKKVQLSGWIAKENLKGNPSFLDVILEDENWPEKLPPIPSPDERAYLLLEGLVEKTDIISRSFPYDSIRLLNVASLNRPGAFFWALTYCSQEQEMRYLLSYLQDSGLVKYDRENGFYVTVKGFEKNQELSKNFHSKTAFIAMWFNSYTDNLYNCIEKAVRKAGYKPLRIDRKDHINKIDDQILVEINRARFVICDLTSETGKPRGNVYFEAGYAMGRGVPIIWTCERFKKNKSEENRLQTEIPFDIRQYNCLFWEDDKTDNFIRKLQYRIENVIGSGSLKERKTE